MRNRRWMLSRGWLVGASVLTLAAGAVLAGSAAAGGGVGDAEWGTGGGGAPARESAAGERAASAVFTVDPVHSTLNYRVRHFGVSWFYGRVNLPEGEFSLDPADPGSSRVRVVAHLKNMDAGDEGRDRFLQGPDFFNAREFPRAEFVGSGARRLDDGAWEVAGDFTMRGVKRPVTVRLEEYTEAQTTKFGYRAGFLCTFTIKRSDFGMDLFVKEGTLGDEVEITASIEGVRE